MSVGKLLFLIDHNFRLAWSYKINFFGRYLSGLMTMLIFYFLDVLLQQSGQASISEGTYFTFALIGGAFFRYLTLTSQAFSTSLREEMLMGTIEPLLVTATPVTVSILGPSSWLLIQASSIVVGQLLVGALLGADFAQANWGSALVLLLISLSIFASFGIVSAAFAIVFKRSDPVTTFISSIAYILSGVFFPVEVFPPWLRILSYLLPTTYALRALRGALMGGASLADLAVDVVILLGFAAVFTPLSIWALRYAIRRMKDTGELAHY
ncbi:MAG: ABC transporter permease [Chloroflexota bacterium]|nr:MAG: ABC transporter permease [Chloroflexota bacterium]